MKEQVSLRGGELLPRLVHRNALATRELRQSATLVVVPRLGPGVYRAIAQGTRRGGNDERLVVFQNRPEPVALRASAARVVEREQLWRRSRRKRTVVRALKPFRERQFVDCKPVERGNDVVRKQDHTVTLA